MEYKCPVCGKLETGDFLEYTRHTEEHIVELIRQKNPRWTDKDGICRKCADYYRKQIKGE